MRRVLALGLLVLVGLWLVSLAAVTWISRHDAARAADAIVVLGAAQYNGYPSPVLKARLDHATRLFRRHLAPRLIVTGGVGTGDGVNEAIVILVSDGFHMLRLDIIAWRFGLEPLGSPAPRSPIRASRRIEALYLLAESVKAPAAFIVTRGE